MSDLVIKKIKQWRYNPYLFVVEALGARELKDKKTSPHLKVITSQQRRCLEDLGKLVLAKKKFELKMPLTDEEHLLVKKTGISIKSGKGSGKTAFLAWTLLWFLICYKRSLVPCTASKLEQVKDVLWREVSKWISHSAVHGKYGSFIKDSLEVESEKIFVKNHSGKVGKEWFAIARSAGQAANEDTPSDALQGFHEQHMMIIVDEASGVRKGVFSALDQTLSDPCNFMIMTYNPSRTSGFAYDSQHKNKFEWLCYRWNCEESENVDPESNDKIARKYGKDSNAYRVSVQGLEPEGDTDSVIPLEWVLQAVDRPIEALEDDPLVVGIDVGRQGDDPSIILSRRGGVVQKNIERMNWDNTMKVVGRVSEFVSEENPDAIGIDVIGVGAGVYDRLRELGVKITPVNVANSAWDKEKFERLRDELWWRLREDFEQGRISIPEDDELIFELSNVKYEVLSTGKIKVESKKQMKIRGVASPNKADSLVLTKYFKDRVYRSIIAKNGRSDIMKKKRLNVRNWTTV